MRHRPCKARRIALTTSRALMMGTLVMGAPVRSGMVTLNVKNGSGAAAEDAVVVFDPLDATPPPGHGTAIIDQIDKKFAPKVTVIRTGTAVTFPNSDRIRHQVYSFSPPKPFSLKLYAGSPRVEVVFDKPGMVVLGCNIHDTMLAFVGVVDTPYFTKITGSGSAELNLPAGRYRMRVWHPTMTGFAPKPITVGSEPMMIPLTVEMDPARDAVATWPE